MSKVFCSSKHRVDGEIFKEMLSNKEIAYIDCLQFHQLNDEIKKLNYNEFHTPIAINKSN